MKKILLIALACGFLASCNSNTYTINGVVEMPELEGKTVYRMWNDTPQNYGVEGNKDSTLITNGKFTFKGEVTGPNFCNLYIPGPDPRVNDPYMYSTVVLEKGDISVTLHSKFKTTVSGTPLNEVMQKHETEYGLVQDRFNKAYYALQDAEKNGVELPAEELEQLNKEIAECRKLFVELNYNYAKENVNNPAVWSMDLYNASIQAGTAERMKEPTTGADEFTKTLPVYKEIVKKIETLERTAVGSPFTDFTMNDPDGKEVKLSDYVGKGKYVLVDFWASWCGPCKAEMPNVVKAYKKYAGKDFEIVGVSLDRSKDNWVKAIKEWNMPWPHMSDLKAWDCVGTKLYGVTGVPCTILFDRDGKILARNLRGEELYNKLGELLK